MFAFLSAPVVELAEETGRELVLNFGGVATPLDLEGLLAQIRAQANVSTRTTIVLSTPFENRS